MSAQLQKAVLSEQTRFMLAQQLPAIKHCLTIATTCGEIHITDQSTISEIKAVIERKYVEPTFRIDDKPARIGFFAEADESDIAVTIQTEKGNLLGFTRADAQKLINKLTETLKSFDCMQKED